LQAKRQEDWAGQVSQRPGQDDVGQRRSAQDSGLWQPECGIAKGVSAVGTEQLAEEWARVEQEKYVYKKVNRSDLLF